jgi:hypothetical protein
MENPQTRPRARERLRAKKRVARRPNRATLLSPRRPYSDPTAQSVPRNGEVPYAVECTKATKGPAAGRPSQERRGGGAETELNSEK